MSRPPACAAPKAENGWASHRNREARPFFVCFPYLPWFLRSAGPGDDVHFLEPNLRERRPYLVRVELSLVIDLKADAVGLDVGLDRVLLYPR